MEKHGALNWDNQKNQLFLKTCPQNGILRVLLLFISFFKDFNFKGLSHCQVRPLHLQFAWCGVFNGSLQQSVIDGLSGQVAEVQQLHTQLV